MQAPVRHTLTKGLGRNADCVLSVFQESDSVPPAAMAQKPRLTRSSVGSGFRIGQECAVQDCPWVDLVAT